MIIGGPASQLLASKVAAILGDELALCDYKTFPDGESYTQVITQLEDKIVIIQSTPTDRDLICLLQLLDICRDRNISLIIPYFGYARQDKIFKHGESMTARAVVTALNPFLKKSRVRLINIHANSVLSHFQCEAVNLDATPLLADKIGSSDMEDAVVISPDKGAWAMAQTAAAFLGTACDCLEKIRLSGTEVDIVPKEIDIKGRDVIIFDDMIASGGTMAATISLLRNQGARKVHLAAVHPVLIGNAILKLYHAGVENIIATDTLDRSISVVSVASLIAQSL